MADQRQAAATDSQPAARRGSLGVAIALLAALALGALYLFFPRQADLTAFDPQAMGRLETAMWRHYYEKRYVALARDLYDAARRQQGFSSWDSMRIAIAAASADGTFQPTTSRAQAEKALGPLKTYFSLLARGAPVKVDVDEAARTELAWWQARRDAVPAPEYGLLIAHVTTLLYGVAGEDVQRAGVLRAQAMDYRDAHAGSMTEADWNAITDALQRSYAMLKTAVTKPH